MQLWRKRATKVRRCKCFRWCDDGDGDGDDDGDGDGDGGDDGIGDGDGDDDLFVAVIRQSMTT